MQQMNVGDFRRLSKEEMKEIAPIEILFEGESIGYFVNKGDVMMLADLHPRVQRRFRALEEKIRIGMPK